MNSYGFGLTVCLSAVLWGSSSAQEATEVLMTDSGVQIVTIGPGAPPHTIGLQGHRQVITMDTGARIYGLRYGVALDPNDPKAAIPGEGYIGMPQPVGCNWYAGGFFDVVLNGQSIGKTFIHSLTGRTTGNRGTTDFVFDTSQAVVRVRFVARAGEDCLLAQVLLEPKVEIKSVRISVRCYPSAFVSHAGRHVLTSKRDLAQGERADLNVADEWWTLYYDDVYDAGCVSAQHTGAGPCAVLWLPAQTEKAGFNVGGYGIDTVFQLQPELRDFRFVFFDYAGKTNDVAKADLRKRAPALLDELADFAFTDPLLARWPLAEKQAEVEQVLALVPDDKHAAAQYARWAKELAAQLELVRSHSAGAILAEAEAATTISQWQRGLPALKLKALLNKI